MEIKICDFNEVIEKSFDSLSNKNNSPYQNYGWLRVLNEASSKNPVLRVSSLYKCIVLTEKERVRAIAPVVFNKYGNRKKKIMCWGYNLSTDYTDFLYDEEMTIENITFFLDAILKITGKQEIWFTSLPEESLTYKAIQSMPHQVLTQRTCVSIPMYQKSFDEWYGELSKSMRQNIRTARNRLATDGKKGLLKIYHNEELSPQVISSLQELYEKRRLVLNDTNNSLIYNIKKVYRKLSLKRYCYMGEAMRTNKSSLILIYSIDESIAAFGHALIHSPSHSPTFMQVAFDEKYKRYSPGILMFSDYIKTLDEEFERPEYCDLSLGTEKYKYDLGGKNHYTVSVRVAQNAFQQ